MATYANATNPFIKPGESSSANGASQGSPKHQIKKSAPGMARPLSLLDEISKGRIEDEISTPDKQRGHQGRAPSDEPEKFAFHDQNNNAGADVPLGPEHELGEHDECSALQAQVDLLEADLDDEIAQACKSLVEQAANVSIGDEHCDKRTSSKQVVEATRPPPAGQAPSDTDLAGGVNLKLSTKETESRDDNKRSSGDEEREAEDEGEEKVLDDIETDERLGSQEDEGDGPAFSTRDSGGRRHQHIELIKKLRLQLRDLERYAHERGELERMPASVLLERQTVILDTLRKKLPNFSLDKDKIQKLELEELKRQADDEINSLIDPIMTKEHLLKQLKTQLTDLERYVSHLHGTFGITNGSCSPVSASAGATKLASCACVLHGCSSPPSLVGGGSGLLSGHPMPTTSPSSSSSRSRASSHSSSANNCTDQAARQGTLIGDTLPKTSRLIRGLMAQLICSDLKIQEAMRMEKNFGGRNGAGQKGAGVSNGDVNSMEPGKRAHELPNPTGSGKSVVTTKPPQFHDSAAWTLHIDRVILATDSLTNIYTLTQEPSNRTTASGKQSDHRAQHVDHSLVDSVVRRQLLPAVRDLLAYGLIDPSSLPPRPSYASFIFDPYYLLSSLTCLPGSQTSSSKSELATASSVSVGAGALDKIHTWHVIADYYESRNEPNFRNSSVKTLSQSFNLTSTTDGPIKITSKQALLIAIDDITERLARCKPNGPESHLKLFVYTALNQGKLATWIKIIFRNKSIMRKYYHNFSFVCQPDKMDRFLSIIDALARFEFKLNTDTEAMDQFVSAF